MLGTFFEVQNAFRMAGAGISILFKKCVAGAGVREGCENVGRRGGFEEAPKRCVSRGTGLRMPRPNFFVAGAVLLKYPLKNR